MFKNIVLKVENLFKKYNNFEYSYISEDYWQGFNDDINIIISNKNNKIIINILNIDDESILYEEINNNIDEILNKLIKIIIINN
jgi:hypothetical protein